MWLPRRLRRRWLAGLGAIAVLLAGATVWAVGRTTDSATAASTPTLVTVSAGTVRQVVSATGTIQPAQQADLSFAVSGTVTAVSAKVGDVVAAGATLATVDDQALQAAREAAQASLDAAKAQLTAEQGTTATDVQIAAAKAQVAAATSRLATAAQAVADASLTSPIAGTVAAVNITAGDRVGGSSGGSGGGSSGGSSAGSSGGSSAGSTAQITVISTKAWVVDTAVTSADLARVTKGLQAEVVPTGNSTRVFGTVRSVGIVASASTGGTASFPVVVAVTGNPGGLYAGGTADVSIIVRQQSDVLTVPTVALRTVNGKTVVRQMKGGRQVDTPVQVGAVYGVSTEIRAGLKAGDQVVVTAFRTGGAGGGGGFRGGGGFPGGGFTGGGGGFTGGGSAGGGN